MDPATDASPAGAATVDQVDDVCAALDRDGYALDRGRLGRRRGRGRAHATFIVDPRRRHRSDAPTSRAQDPPRVRALRQDPRDGRPRDPTRRARRARPGARPLPAERADRHRDRSGRDTRSRCTPTTRSIRAAPPRRARRQRDVAARATSPRRTAATRVVPGSHRWVDEFPTADTPTHHRRDAGRLRAALPRQPVARRRREPHRPAPARRRAALLGVVVAPGREPRARRPARAWPATCRSGSRSCSATTSSRRSSATSTAATRRSCSFPERATHGRGQLRGTPA